MTNSLLPHNEAGELLTHDRAQTYAEFLKQVDDWGAAYGLLDDLLRPGDLVFNVGAHNGARTRIYRRRLRVRVVAIEPLLSAAPQLVGELVQQFGNNADPDVILEPVALSSGTGAAAFYIAPGASYFSSIDETWVKTSYISHYFTNKPVQVAVTTLDALIERYGLPRFIKIDAEGHDYAVLRGLTQPVKSLCFEAIPKWGERLRLSMQHLVGLGAGRYSYNYAMDNTPTWGLAQWEPDSGIFITHLEAALTGEHWADVHARLTEST